ncbi:hypothetical protein KOR42_29770 [Thalassoglobus neptunius]|uniref:Uncharacterized protein n=1 Tax=Thalassoglobus neptunius TaxID=1938619 RepID=A0A5C5WQC5_9PLAN|nr:hypothetical protein KOR42_29770 [Thalassoglobus neptunius]
MSYANPSLRCFSSIPKSHRMEFLREPLSFKKLLRRLLVFSPRIDGRDWVKSEGKPDECSSEGNGRERCEVTD